MKRIGAALLFGLLNFFSVASYAWNHSVELGYGISHDPNHTRYYNSGFLLTADLYPFYRSPKTFWSLNGGLGQWHSSAPSHQVLTTGALALALRYYPFHIYSSPAYLLGSVGPAILSQRQFGKNKQGSNVAFQINAGLGVELNQKIDVNLRLAHYSNAHIAHPDQGYTVLYLLSVGYLF